MISMVRMYKRERERERERERREKKKVMRYDVSKEDAKCEQ
jgi:hypothetical protein